MRYFILSILLVSMACFRKSADCFVLRGDVPGAPDSTQVTLAYDPLCLPMETYVIDGKFEFRGKMDKPAFCLLRLNTRTCPNVGKDFKIREMDFFVENGELRFETQHLDSLAVAYYTRDVKKERNYRLIGSATQDVYYRYQQQTLEQRDLVATLESKCEKSQCPEDYNRWRKERDKLDRTTKDFIRSQSNLFVNLLIARRLKREPLSYDQAYLDELEQLFSSYRDTCSELRELREYVWQAAAFVKNPELGDGEVFTQDGKSVQLCDLLNKDGYTLIDLWASWCGACRAGIPYLKGVYERYGDRVKFVGIALGDNDKAWKDALAKEQMPWEQFVDRGEVSVMKRDKYNLTTIPQLLLVSPERKVVYCASRSGDMESFLQTLF